MVGLWPIAQLPSGTGWDLWAQLLIQVEALIALPPPVLSTYLGLYWSTCLICSLLKEAPVAGSREGLQLGKGAWGLLSSSSSSPSSPQAGLRLSCISAAIPFYPIPGYQIV